MMKFKGNVKLYTFKNEYNFTTYQQQERWGETAPTLTIERWKESEAMTIQNHTLNLTNQTDPNSTVSINHLTNTEIFCQTQLQRLSDIKQDPKLFLVTYLTLLAIVGILVNSLAVYFFIITKQLANQSFR